MAITKTDLQLSGISYSNKDFGSIYPELVAQAKSLTNKWDPETTNESDPCLVMIKELAFIADKLNYNGDKNILEVFITSATQEEAVRKICDMLGYNMKYYRSAVTDISFQYNGKNFDSSSASEIVVKRGTVITDTDSSIKYTTTKDLSISKANTVFSVEAIQGTLTQFTVGDSEIISLRDLDDNNRLSLDTSMVAENGIYITSLENGEENKNVYWDKVDNLNTTVPGTYCYKVGYDSDSGVPYIEFPDDISDLIGSGIKIEYVITNGGSGNVQAGFLNTVETTDSITGIPEDEELTDVLTVSNMSATNTGYDPETLNEAYNGFKKTIGTFSTIVTPRDYSNAAYNIMYEDGNSVVSNIVCADRRTDLNYSNYVTTFNEYGQVKKNNADDNKITAYDLCIYPLNPIVSDNYNITSYRSSFAPLTYLEDLKDIINEYSIISHDYKELDSEDIYAIKNYGALNCTLYTTTKVTDAEASDIEENVRYALYENFNARKVDYGYEIPRENVLSVIENADTRIKSVNLNDITYTTKFMRANGDEYGIDEPYGAKDFMTVMAKNILNGRISLFDYDKDFNYTFGQATISSGTGPKLEYVIKVTPEVKINKNALITGSGLGYTLKGNQVIQCVAPHISTDMTYPYGINYKWTGASQVDKDTNYTIKNTEQLILEWTDSNDVNQLIIYTSNKIMTSSSTSTTFSIFSETEVEKNIIKPNFDLTNADGSKEIIINTTSYNLKSLGSSEQIEHRNLVKSSLTSDIVPCYWIRENSKNALFRSTDYVEGTSPKQYQIMLNENEYFMYSNEGLNELVVLGSGTQLTLILPENATLDESQWVIDTENYIDIDVIEQKGLSAFSSYNWQYKQFSSDGSKQKMDIQELQILTLIDGNSCRIDGTLASDYVTNTFQEVDGDIYYTIDSETTKLDTIADVKWKICSRLDLDVGPSKSQVLQKKSNVYEESIAITYSVDRLVEVSAKTVTLTGNEEGNTPVVEFRFNTELQKAGSSNMDMQVYYPASNIRAYDVSAFVFNYTVPSYINQEGNTTTLTQNEYGYYVINPAQVGYDKTINLPVMSIHNVTTEERYPSSYASNLFMIYIVHEGEETSQYILTANGGTGKGVRWYNDREDPRENDLQDSITLHDGLNIIEYNKCTSLTLNPKSNTYSIQYDDTSGTKVSRTSYAIGSDKLWKSYYSQQESGNKLIQAKAAEVAYELFGDETKYKYNNPTASLVKVLSSQTESGTGYNYCTIQYRNDLTETTWKNYELSEGTPWTCRDKEHMNLEVTWLKYTGHPLANKTNVKITQASNDVIIMSDISIVDGLNDDLGISDNSDEFKAQLMLMLYNLGRTDGKNIFYYNCEINNATKIQVNDSQSLSNPLSFFDFNNIGNKFTIEEIDFTNSVIKVANSSRSNK